MSTLTIGTLAKMDPKAVSLDNFTDYGWWDWFCKDTVLVRFTPRFITFAKRIQEKFGHCNYFLKNVSPMAGGHFHTFIIQNSKKDNVYWICNEHGTWSITMCASGRNVADGLTLHQLAYEINKLDVPK